MSEIYVAMYVLSLRAKIKKKNIEKRSWDTRHAPKTREMVNIKRRIHRDLFIMLFTYATLPTYICRNKPTKIKVKRIFKIEKKERKEEGKFSNLNLNPSRIFLEKQKKFMEFLC